jgi:hypothetical protein
MPALLAGNETEEILKAMNCHNLGQSIWLDNITRDL